MGRNYKISHDDMAVRVELPQHLGIKTMDGRLKTGIVLVYDAMVDIKKQLKYLIS